MQEKARNIAGAREHTSMVDKPAPGEYVITGLQAGNMRGENGWHLYIGYVVQVRKKAGAFGSDMLLLRHPDGTLMAHENQCYWRLDGFWLKEAQSLFPEGMTPGEHEDYSEPYTLGGEYPELGRVIEPKTDGPPRDDRPMMQITTESADGSKTLTVV